MSNKMRDTKQQILDENDRLKKELSAAKAQTILLRKAIDALEKFASTVAPSSSFWEEVWPKHEEAINAEEIADLIVCEATPIEAIPVCDCVEGKHPNYGIGLFATNNCVIELFRKKQ